jgi:hypothetical protein
MCRMPFLIVFMLPQETPAEIKPLRMEPENSYANQNDQVYIFRIGCDAYQ